MFFSARLLPLAFLAVFPLAADTTYTYEGHFTNLAGADYTTNDFVSGSVTFASPLGPDMPLTFIPEADLLAWSISDQVYSVSSSSAGTLPCTSFIGGPFRQHQLLGFHC
jgi:hypothetical protein